VIGGKILNSSATLNSFEVIQSIEFFPGEEIKLVIQLFQRQRIDQLRFMVEDPAAILLLEIPNKDGTDATFTMTPLAGDSSIWSVTLDAEATSNLAGGNMVLTLTQNDSTSVGVIQNGIQLVVAGGSC
jgi:hypothetical protein